jgi:hypothetical protein
MPFMRMRSSCRTTRLSKVSTRELATGSGLQIPLKLQGRFFLIEFDDDETPPRPIRSGVRRQARIVCHQPRVEIRCHPHVVLGRSGDALENVDEALGDHGNVRSKTRTAEASPIRQRCPARRWQVFADVWRCRSWSFCDSEALQSKHAGCQLELLSASVRSVCREARFASRSLVRKRERSACAAHSSLRRLRRTAFACNHERRLVARNRCTLPCCLIWGVRAVMRLPVGR